jgi:hypothetical protein
MSCPGLTHGCPVEENLQSEAVQVCVASIFNVMPRLDRGIQGRPERLFVALDCPVKPGNDNKS